MTKHDTIKKGHGSSERPLAREIWDRDPVPPIAAHREDGDYRSTYNHVAYERYYDREFAALEHKKIFGRSWLMACREEDLPDAGDRLPFEVGRSSILIVNAGTAGFRAFFNSCTHRGTKLCDRKESADSIVCPYHAWRWKPDGGIQHIPSHWDFKRINAKNGALRPVRLERWGGFIFINMDPDAPSLQESLGVIPKHFECFKLEQRYTYGHFRRLIHANWKLAQEAFIESYHVVGTHPAALPFSGSTQAQYDIYDDGVAHVGRQLTPNAVPSMDAPAEATVGEAVAAVGSYINAMYYPDSELPEFEEGLQTRHQLASWMRDLETKRIGEACTLSDGALLDFALYFHFPGNVVWLSEALPLTYSFLPHEDDPEKCYIEVRMLRRYPDGTERPAPAPMISVGADEWIVDKAPIFGVMAEVFDQDFGNLPKVQAGMRASDPRQHYAQLGDYQELIMKRWHEIVDEMLARP